MMTRNTVQRTAGLTLLVLGILLNEAVAQRQESVTLGLEGYCPVAIQESNQWKSGQDVFRAWYDGILYQFESYENQQKFLEDPGRYIPAYGGICTVCKVEENMTKQGSIMFTCRYNNRLYLFPNEQVKAKFRENEPRYARIGIGNDGNCIVSQVESQSTVPGKPEFVEFYQNRMYNFSSRENQLKFRSDPGRFVPN